MQVKVQCLPGRGVFVLKAAVSTEDKRITKHRVYEASLVWSDKKSASGSNWRFLVLRDNRGEQITFDVEAFTTS